MKKVLCYGDSNTWGYRPASGSRFGKNVRWPSLMSEYLKGDYKIIEEGLSGRSALNLYPGYDSANGIDCIKKIIGKHIPVDIALIFLGLNDIFAAPDEPLWKIVNAIEEIADTIEKAHTSFKFHPPEILLIGLPEIGLTSEEAQFYEIAINKVRAFSGLLSQSALNRGYHFIDIYGEIKTSHLDGTHLGDKEHKKLAHITADYLNRLP
jgi:lysophospholipase L1-like esterase